MSTVTKKELEALHNEVSHSSLYSEELAPVPPAQRTWNKWNLAALWVGMAVCIPTYLLASYMIKSGLSWQASLIIIALANLVITIPMVLNGHSGVKYGIPFPVLGRATFGHKGIHIPTFLRGIVACGWFGVQTWIGGLAFYSIWIVLSGQEPSLGLDTGKFVCFGLFWLINIFFIWKGTESIKWLEIYSAPILILIGLFLIYWGYQNAGAFSTVLNQGVQMQKPTAELFINDNTTGEKDLTLHLMPLKNTDGTLKASEYQIILPAKAGSSSNKESGWIVLNKDLLIVPIPFTEADNQAIISGKQPIQVQLRNANIQTISGYDYSTTLVASINKEEGNINIIWKYILWFTAMVGFWATMSLSIADITRYAKTQKDQIIGQFMGLPGTMLFYSFVGIFVTCAALISFKDILIAEDAPWDPVSLLSKFKSPAVVVFAQILMIIATLSTNIAANVIAPANAFSNMYPQKINFRRGGIITGLIGIAICPWWLMNDISSILIFVSGLLGPVLGILLCDYYLIKKSVLHLPELYKHDGIYSYQKGYNASAMIAMLVGIFFAVIGKWIPQLEILYSLSWFTGFIVAFVAYYFMMKSKITKQATVNLENVQIAFEKK